VLWWGWTGRQRLIFLGAMIVISAAPWILAGWFPRELGAFVGGVAFLFIPQLVGWMLLVGLKTGRIPTRSSSQSRTDSPLGFRLVAATYILILIVYSGILARVLVDIAAHGLD
jgi:hypothetical protein